jgi:phage terminase small subunit
MPRRSAASLTIPRVDGKPPRLEPPAGLDRKTAAVFTRLVEATPLGHFVASDTPLVVEFCRAVIMAERADRELRQNGPVIGTKPSPWITVQEKAVRSLTALSLRLRLAPQARQDPKTAHRRAQRPTIPPPWEQR